MMCKSSGSQKSLRSSASTPRTGAALLVVAGCLLPGCSRHNEGPTGPMLASGEPASSAVNRAMAEHLSAAIMDVAKNQVPAVVHIQVFETKVVNNPLLPFENSPGFRFFFGLPRNMPKKFRHQRVGIGSGILLDAQGHILTNNHVVDKADRIQVRLFDGRRFAGKVVGTDPNTDLAVIQISTSDPLPFLAFGNSDEVQVGQWVIAIGQPEGMNESVTQGIISAKHRTGLAQPTSYQDFLQTDAAINPGNSGGPLLTLDGDVIGVNSAILSESGGFMGIGFAIPSNMAVYVAKQLIAQGKVERGWLGITIRDLGPQLTKSLGAKTAHGALIQGIVDGGPAAQAGLQVNDIVTAYQGEPVPNSSAFRNSVAMTAPDKQAALTVLRDGKQVTVSVKVGSLQEAGTLLAADAKQHLGGEFKSVTLEQARQLRLPHRLGVVVSSVTPDGPLAQAGFEVGDLILAINGHPISEPEDFEAVVSTLQAGQSVMLLAMDFRTGDRAEVPVVPR